MKTAFVICAILILVACGMLVLFGSSGSATIERNKASVTSCQQQGHSVAECLAR